jgi:tellurite methyltransferase
MSNPYDIRYAGADYYWGTQPSALCPRVLELAPPERSPRLLDIGCGEGPDAVFFARSGYSVSAFDSSPQGVEKAARRAREAGVQLDVFTADLLTYRPDPGFDVLFSTGVLHYVPPEMRGELFAAYREGTVPGGVNAFSVFVEKPFVAAAPDAEPTAHPWVSGELLTHYRDWHIDYFFEEVVDCTSSGVPHQHAVNRMVARRPST